jgi:hypothetical protein
MALTLFPDNMMKSAVADMSLEGIAGRLTYFHEQLHLIHWQTSIYAEHMAMGSLYEYIQDFKDDVIEKLMGYTGRKPRAFKIMPVSDGMGAVAVVTEVKMFAAELEQYAEANGYGDISNMSQDLSGHAVKTLYLLTLS